MPELGGESLPFRSLVPCKGASQEESPRFLRGLGQVEASAAPRREGVRGDCGIEGLLTDAMEDPPCRTHTVLDPSNHIPGSCLMSTPQGAPATAALCALCGWSPARCEHCRKHSRLGSIHEFP